MVDVAYIGIAADDAFGEQEAQGQLQIVARSAHGNGDGFLLTCALFPEFYSNFKRLLYRQQVGRISSAVGFYLFDGNRMSAVGVHDW